MRKVAMFTLVLFLTGLFGCSDSGEEENLKISLEFDGLYNGVASLSDIHLGVWQMAVERGRVSGYYDDGSPVLIDFSGTVQEGGKLQFVMTLNDDTRVDVSMVIDQNKNLTGIWTDSDGESGTITGSEATSAYDGTYSGTASAGGSQIGSWQMTIDSGSVYGDYTEDSESTAFSGYINNAGKLSFRITFDDGIITSVNASVTAGGNVTGTWNNTEGESGSLSGKGKNNTGSGGTGNNPGGGNTVSSPGNGMVDADGNQYSTVIIGANEWTVENLRTTRYANGDEIPNVTDYDPWTGSWNDLTTGAWIHYENNSSHDEVYGKLYNGFAATDPRGLCPYGWHVATDDEVQALSQYLYDYFDDIEMIYGNVGGLLKETGTSHWKSPNAGTENRPTDNATGFTALPGGILRDGYFVDLGEEGWWWTSTEDDNNSGAAYSFSMTYIGATVTAPSQVKRRGLSCRCVKD